MTFDDGLALLSLGTTIAGVGAGVALAASGGETAGATVIVGSVVVLPSLGRALGGDLHGAAAFIGGRLAGLAGGLLFAAGSRSFGGLFLATVVSGTAIGIIDTVDIAGTPSALARHRLEIAPASIGDRHAAGVSVTGSF
jgi:hypothetical protein